MTSTGTISLPSSRLVEALASVLPHASKDTVRPVLNSVHVYVDHGHILFEATDRYTMAMHRTPAVARTADDQTTDAWWDGELDILIELDDVKRVIALAKADKLSLPVTITASGDGWVDVSVVYGSGIRFRSYDFADFPRLQPLVPAVTDQNDGHVSWDPKNMARVTASALALKGRSKAAPVVTVLAGKRATGAHVFTIGSDFLGVLMPVGIDEPYAARTSWDGMLSGRMTAVA